MISLSVVLKLLQAKLDSSGLDWITLQSLRVSPGNRQVEAEVLLAGEEKPVHVEATYEVTSDNHVRIVSVTTSRKWMTEIAELALVKSNPSFPLPDGIKGRLIRMVL